MTLLLLGGASLLIVVSAVMLLLGWANAQASLVIGSIAASALVFVLLGAAYWLGRRAARAPARSPDLFDVQPVAPPREPEAVRSESGPPPAVAEPEPPEPAPEPVVAAAPAPRRKPARRAVARRSDRSTAKPKPNTKKDVVAFPERARYHKPDCRYAKGKGGEKMPRQTARRRGYSPCGICKP